ncbi:hypothetical protein E2I14_17645 [Sapientia aquatica]|uniref:Uncharacterized protein n=1 Tax=Sapientia aquatica TaxID=1549640 RepID=A0A4R5VRV1_9BURK|nr:hypothetical protein E2I14_17645 [Sapientia aquatica]
MIYSATTIEQAELELCQFEQKWSERFSPIGESWRKNWPRLPIFFTTRRTPG